MINQLSRKSAPGSESPAAHTVCPTILISSFLSTTPSWVCLLGEIPQLGQLIQQLLQFAIGDFVLQTRNKGLGLLGIVTTQTS